MKVREVYVWKHEGIWPIGACSVTTGEDEAEAFARLGELLKPLGLDKNVELVWRGGGDTFNPDMVILDGDY